MNKKSNNLKKYTECSFQIAISVGNALIWLSWLYGIYGKQTMWMVPAYFINTTVNVLYSIFYSLLLFTQLCIGAIMIFMLDTFSEESITNLHSESAIVLCMLCILSIWCAVNAGKTNNIIIILKRSAIISIVLFNFLACLWHMSAVSSSLYKTMKKDERADAKLIKINV